MYHKALGAVISKCVLHLLFRITWRMGSCTADLYGQCNKIVCLALSVLCMLFGKGTYFKGEERKEIDFGVAIS